MKPAISVILLTTLIGAGQGLFLAYYSAEWFVLLSMLEPSQNDASGLAAALSLLLLVAGLVASFFHLGHPERAWRAAAMWRSSWLSREAIALPSAMLLILLYALLKLGGLDTVVFRLGGIPISLSTLCGVGAVLAVCALFVCTAMIYACLKFLRQWHSPLTVLNFLLMGCASGFTLATAIAAWSGDQRFAYFSGMAIFLTCCGLLSRYASLVRNSGLRSPSTLQSAIGVHHPTIRQIAQGAMGGSFNTRAFMHDYGRALPVTVPGIAGRALVFFHRGGTSAEYLLPDDFLARVPARRSDCKTILDGERSGAALPAALDRAPLAIAPLNLQYHFT
jgi:DMSO reductase anchor subunit